MIITALILYISFLLYFSWRNLSTPFRMDTDRGREYNVCLSLSKGHFSQDKDLHTLNSCLLMVMPAIWLHKVFGGKLYIWFELIPTFFFALAPTFIFLTASEFVSIGYALLAVGIFAVSFQVLYYTDIGRNGMGLGIMAVLFWAVLQGNWILILISGCLLAITHYGTIHYALFVFGGSLLTALIFGLSILSLSLTVNVLLGSIWVWYSILMNRVGGKCSEFLNNVLAGNTMPGLSRLNAKAIPDTRLNTALDSRDVILRVALGQSWKHMKTPQKIEFITSWILVIGMNLALLVAFIHQPVSLMWLVSLWAYGTIWMAILVPMVSRGYGISRTCFTSLVFILPFISIELQVLGAYGFIIVPFLMVHGLLVSGLLHQLWNINKHEAGVSGYSRKVISLM